MSSPSESEDELPELGSDDEDTSVVRRISNTAFEFDVDLNDGSADAAATGLDQSFLGMLEEEQRRQSINNNNSASTTRVNVTKLPNTLGALLDPDEIIGIMERNSITIAHDTSVIIRPTSLDLDEMLNKLLNDVIMQSNIDTSTFAPVMVPIIPYNSPDLQFDMSSETLSIKSMTVTIMEIVVNKTSQLIHPYRVVANIISHARKFTYFNSLNPDWISDHIYMNFLETNQDYVTTQLNYKPELDNMKEWVKNIVRWKSNGLSIIFTNGLSESGYSAAPETIRMQEQMFSLLIFIAVMYSHTHNVYKELGRTDLADYWKLSLEERQGELIDKRPQTIAQRFVFKYESAFAAVPRQIQQQQNEEGDLIDRRARRNRPMPPMKQTTLPTKQVTPPVKQTTPTKQVTPTKQTTLPIKQTTPPTILPPVPIPKDKLIYYTYQMEALINQIKVLNAMIFMSQNKETSTLFHETDVNQSLNLWMNKANVLLIQCQRDSNIFSNNSHLSSLYKIIETLYTRWS